MILSELIVSAASIFWAGSLLPAYGDVIAEKTGLGVLMLGIWPASIGERLALTTLPSRSFAGNLSFAPTTSLPEIAKSLAAIHLGAIDLAIGNVPGSNLFDIMLLAK
jgi:Ca2+/Na+ antiporter